jgi:ubiquitin carboxyl-terminal hydrolase 8
MGSLTSSGLEDSLSLSPEHQRKAFFKRDQADVVVLYDSHSMGFPRLDSPPTPISRLWDIIYEHEFHKKLVRTPVLLTGGYDAWVQFIRSRQKIHEAANAAAAAKAAGRPYNPKGMTEGYSAGTPL